MTTMRRMTRSDETGFTLVELMVVIIIIGILAAIAIPIFAQQRHKAADATVRFDLHTVALGLETYRTDAQTYPAAKGDLSGGVRLSPGVTIDVYRTAQTYCLVGNKTGGVEATRAWVYDSVKGGLQTDATAVCPGTPSFTLP